MAAIRKALDECSAVHPVFYEDEVDIHLDPKIGADWQLRGQQKRVVTPGKNEKYYLAGALHSGKGWWQQQEFGAVHRPAESPESQIQTGKNHHTYRG